MMSHRPLFVGLALSALGAFPVAEAARAAGGGWPTHGRDVRRTGQSPVVGPHRIGKVTTFRAPDERAINVPATVAGDGTAYFGTWGMIRSYGGDDRTVWDKSDGKVFAVTPGMEPAWPDPYPAHPVPYCYHYGDRPPTPGQCPGGGTVNFYNGTVEGVGALSPDQSVLYVGRGDGKLYALDAATGTELWAFTTFNPEDPEDPEGGGEVVAGPLVGPNGTVYVATVGVGEYESNAVYALSPEGELLWRYPHSDHTAPNTFFASPALAPDGRTLYVAGAWGPRADDWDTEIPGAVLAFDVAAPEGTGEERLRWVHHPVNDGEWWEPTVWPTRLAVGRDGTLYASGPELTFGGHSAVLFALEDLGEGAESAWDRMVDLDRGEATFSYGLALREVEGATTRVYATSGNVYSHLGARVPPGGVLAAVDPATGELLWELDPEDHGATGALTGIALGADGVVYTGVSGAGDGGRVYAVTQDGELLWEYRLEGLLEWGHPVLGPGGALYVADTKRCPGAFQPLESGACDGRDIDPVLYRIVDSAGPGHWFEDPELPGFRVRVDITSAGGEPQPVRLEQECIPETLCFSGAVPGRSEVFVRVVGPKPNGHLWPTLVKFSTSRIDVWIEQVATGAVRHYVLEAPTPGRDELPGLFDRVGFLP